MRLDMRCAFYLLHLSVKTTFRPFVSHACFAIDFPPVSDIFISSFSFFLLSFFSLFSFFSAFLSSILFTFFLHTSSHCLPQALQGEGIDLPSTFLQDVIDRLIGILLPSKTKKGTMETKGAKGGAENTNEAPTSRTTATIATTATATSAASTSAASTTVRFDERVRQGAAVGLANVLGCGLGCGIR